jgi:DNA-binding transcriptional ArsR family regulator
VADLDAVLRALAAPARREILTLVWERELAAGEIAAAFSLSAPTISEHLAVLREAGLVEMTRAGTSRRYRARSDALAGLQGALEGATKWIPADDIPERYLAKVATLPVVVASVEVDLSQADTFIALTDPAVYARWLGAPVTIRDGRFAATMEWGTEIRGRYELVVPPALIVLSWDFDDENVPLPGRPLTGYLRVEPVGKRRARAEVHQLVDTLQQAEFMEAAWGLVLGRLRKGAVAAMDPDAAMASRPARPKRAR